jgi:hypothetical protein
MEIMKHLFNLIGREDTETMRIFFAWIQNCGLRDIAKMVPA